MANITQRPNELNLPPEVLAARQTERQLEQAEQRFDVETPAWGGVHPVSGVWETPNRPIGASEGVGFWEEPRGTPENWGIVRRDPAPGMADWTAVTPRTVARKGSSGLDPSSLAATRMLHAAAAGAVRRAKPAIPRLPSGRKAGNGRYTAADGAAAAYKAPRA